MILIHHHVLRRRGEEALLRRLSSTWVLLSSGASGGECRHHQHTVKQSDRDSIGHSFIGHDAMRMMRMNHASFSSSSLVALIDSGDQKKNKKTSSQKEVEQKHAKQKHKQKQKMMASHEIVEQNTKDSSSITDRIPPEYLKKGPVSVAEGTSYTVIILAALGFAAAVAYAAVSELLLSPKEYTCFSKALKKIEEDPRVTIRLGTPVHGYGSESRNRAARQRIPHRIYKDEEGKEHVQIQFHASGPSGRAVVYADMFEDENGVLNEYRYLTVRVLSPVPHDVVLV